LPVRAIGRAHACPIISHHHLSRITASTASALPGCLVCRLPFILRHNFSRTPRAVPPTAILWSCGMSIRPQLHRIGHPRTLPHNPPSTTCFKKTLFCESATTGSHMIWHFYIPTNPALSHDASRQATFPSARVRAQLSHPTRYRPVFHSIPEWTRWGGWGWSVALGGGKKTVGMSQITHP